MRHTGRGTNARGRKALSQKSEVPRVLVVCEGKRTEPQYVEGLNRVLRNVYVRCVGVGKDPLAVVHACIEERDSAKGSAREYDHCFCLVDVDQHASLLQACEVAAREHINVLVSRLKFEAWLRWHVEDKSSALNTHELDRVVEKLGLVEKKRISPRFPYEQVDEACRRARRADPGLAANRVGPDPSSAMPLLVGVLKGETV